MNFASEVGGEEIVLGDACSSLCLSATELRLCTAKDGAQGALVDDVAFTFLSEALEAALRGPGLRSGVERLTSLPLSLARLRLMHIRFWKRRRDNREGSRVSLFSTSVSDLD